MLSSDSSFLKLVSPDLTVTAAVRRNDKLEIKANIYLSSVKAGINEKLGNG